MAERHKIWRDGDQNCYADRAFGDRYVRDRMADLIDLIGWRGESRARNDILVKSLRGAIPDDGWDEDEGIEVLNTHTDDGLKWVFVEGSLVLLDLSEVEPDLP